MADLHNKIQRAISDTLEECAQIQGLILSEADLEALLYENLKKIDELSQRQKTQNGILTIPLHTQISWFNEQGKLIFKPDITIMETQNALIESSDSIKLPSKGCLFHSTKIFELKFRNKTSKNLSAQIRQDFKKFLMLKKLNPSLFCYFVVVDKFQRNDNAVNLNTFITGDFKRKIINESAQECGVQSMNDIDRAMQNCELHYKNLGFKINSKEKK